MWLIAEWNLSAIPARSAQRRALLQEYGVTPADITACRRDRVTIMTDAAGATSRLVSIKDDEPGNTTSYTIVPWHGLVLVLADAHVNLRLLTSAIFSAITAGGMMDTMLGVIT